MCIRRRASEGLSTGELSTFFMSYSIGSFATKRHARTPAPTVMSSPTASTARGARVTSQAKGRP